MQQLAPDDREWMLACAASARRAGMARRVRAGAVRVQESWTRARRGLMSHFASICLSEPAPRAAGWVPTHRLTRVGCAPAPPTWALTQPALRPLAEQQPALTLAG